MEIDDEQKETEELTQEDIKLLKRVFEYIISIRQKNEDIPVIEAIADFCFKYNYEVEYVGCLISETSWFKNFVQSDCVLNESDSKIEEW